MSRTEPTRPLAVRARARFPKGQGCICPGRNGRFLRMREGSERLGWNTWNTKKTPEEGRGAFFGASEDVRG